MNGGATEPRAVLVSEDTHLGRCLAQLCESAGIEPLLANSAKDAASAVRRFDARLVIVAADCLKSSPSALFDALHPSAPKLVMFGPQFGGVEHVLALELGFHEVWPADVTPLALSALLRSSLRGARTKVRAANREVSFGDFSVDLVGLTCYDGRRPVPVSAGYVQTLAMLVEHAPDVVGREALRSQMASLSDELPSTSRSVDVHISRIRRQLVLGGVTGLRIVHARGHGYRIVTSTGETR